MKVDSPYTRIAPQPGSNRIPFLSLLGNSSLAKTNISLPLLSEHRRNQPSQNGALSQLGVPKNKELSNILTRSGLKPQQKNKMSLADILKKQALKKIKEEQRRQQIESNGDQFDLSFDIAKNQMLFEEDEDDEDDQQENEDDDTVTQEEDKDDIVYNKEVGGPAGSQRTWRLENNRQERLSVRLFISYLIERQKQLRVNAKNSILAKQRKEDEEIPMPKTGYKRINLQNSSFLKLFRQKNATHVGDRENVISVLSNLDYDLVGKQRYRYSMIVSEPDIDIEQRLLVKLGQLPQTVTKVSREKAQQLPRRNLIQSIKDQIHHKRTNSLEEIMAKNISISDQSYNSPTIVNPQGSLGGHKGRFTTTRSSSIIDNLSLVTSSRDVRRQLISTKDSTIFKGGQSLMTEAGDEYGHLEKNQQKQTSILESSFTRFANPQIIFKRTRSVKSEKPSQQQNKNRYVKLVDKSIMLMTKKGLAKKEINRLCDKLAISMNDITPFFRLDPLQLTQKSPKNMVVPELIPEQSHRHSQSQVSKSFDHHSLNLAAPMQFQIFERKNKILQSNPYSNSTQFPRKLQSIITSQRSRNSYEHGRDSMSYSSRILRGQLKKIVSDSKRLQISEKRNTKEAILQSNDKPPEVVIPTAVGSTITDSTIELEHGLYRSDYFHEQLQGYEKSFEEKAKIWQINEILQCSYEGQRQDFYMNRKRRHQTSNSMA